MNTKIMRDKKGFTLIEIIVVIVIMGILLAIAVPSVLGYVKKANEQKYIAVARNGYLAAQTLLVKGKASGMTDVNNLTTYINNQNNIHNEIGEKLSIISVECTLTSSKLELNRCLVILPERNDDFGNIMVEFLPNKSAQITTKR